MLAALLIAVAIIARLVQSEIETSRLQAHYLSGFTRDVGYTVETTERSHPLPANGPYDQRLGYAMIPAFQERLLARGFVVSKQARDSQRMLSLGERGLFLPFEEKDQAGPDAVRLDRRAAVRDRVPAARLRRLRPGAARGGRFAAVHRGSLPARCERTEPQPGDRLGRFGRAVADQALHVVNRHQARPGGSTLATQIEKFRHSPEGRTATPPEKLRQIASASVRAYLNGPQTMLARRTIVVRYLNSVPLAARPHIGEITGIGDGLAAWYGRDFNDVNRILSAPTTGDNVDEQGKTFREVLSLIIAQRAPSYFLNRGYPALQKLTDSYLRLLSNGGVISPALRDAALAAQIERSAPPAAAHVQSFVSRKAVTSARASLLSALGISDLYQLDQFDL